MFAKAVAYAEGMCGMNKQNAYGIRALPVLLISVVTALMLVMVVGCSKAPANLEEYFDAHPDEWTEIEDSYVQSSQGEGVLSSSVDVSGNELIMRASYDVDISMLDEATVAEFKSFMEPYFDQLAPMIADMEEETGFSGITLRVETTDSAGNELATFVYDANGAVQ